jgi:hypothetical protein
MRDFRPETTEAWLPNARGKWTRHVYVRLDEALYVSSTGSRDVARVLIYRCTDTGAERRWGIINAVVAN